MLSSLLCSEIWSGQRGALVLNVSSTRLSSPRLLTPDGEMGEDLMSYLEEKQPAGFVPRAVYSSDGNFLSFYIRNDNAYSEQIDERLTVYRSIRNQEIVGCKVKLLPQEKSVL